MLSSFWQPQAYAAVRRGQKQGQPTNQSINKVTPKSEPTPKAEAPKAEPAKVVVAPTEPPPSTAPAVTLPRLSAATASKRTSVFPVAEPLQPLVLPENKRFSTIETGEKTPLEKTAAQTPVVQTPSEKTPIAQTPIEKAPVPQTPIAQTPIEKTPVAQTPVETTPAQPPVGNTSTEPSTTNKQEEPTEAPLKEVEQPVSETPLVSAA